MKKLLTLVLLALLCSNLQAQEGARIGLKAAYNNTWFFNKNVSDKNSSLDYATSYGMSVGVQFIAMLSPNYGVAAEVLFSTHTQKYDGDLGNNATFTLESSAGYIDIPLMFRAASEKGPYFEIGPQISFMTSTSESFGTSPATIANYDDKSFDEDFNSIGVGAVLGFGVDIKLAGGFRLTPGLRFGYTFTDATTEYSKAELDALELQEKASGNAQINHNVGSQLFGPNSTFGYEKTNRVFGGLNLAFSFTF